MAGSVKANLCPSCAKMRKALRRMARDFARDAESECLRAPAWSSYLDCMAKRCCEALKESEAK